MLARAVSQPKMDAPVMMSLPSERRRTFRTDLEDRNIAVELRAPKGKPGKTIGTVMDLSTEGMKFKTRFGELAVGDRLSIKIQLPTMSGISAFVDKGEGKATNAWSGDFEVARVVRRMDGGYDIGGRLMNLTEADRGLLGLYLSLQTMTA